MGIFFFCALGDLKPRSSNHSPFVQFRRIFPSAFPSEGSIAEKLSIRFPPIALIGFTLFESVSAIIYFLEQMDRQTLVDILSEAEIQNISPIPIIRDFRSESSCSISDIFVVTGPPQSYKTTLAVEIANSFIKEEAPIRRIAWLDCDFKFPISTFKSRSVDLTKVDILRCRSSEELLYGLHIVEHQILQRDAQIRVVVIDGFNAFYWIDRATEDIKDSRDRSVQSPSMIWDLRTTVERMASSLGVKFVITVQDIGNISLWPSSDICSIQFLSIETRKPGKGVVTSGSFKDKFKVDDRRNVTWGKRSLAPKPS